MRYHYLFLLKENTTVEQARLELEPLLADIYEMQDPESGEVQLGGYSDTDTVADKFDSVFLEGVSPVEEIDWDKQWADFAADFHDGLAHINLEPFGGPTLLLKPGSGFGDLSHPTTRLTLSLMAPHIENKTVFDIGSGSGILSIAAVLLGAKCAQGIEIDLNAVAHAQDNAKINHVEDKALFSTQIDPTTVPNESFVVVMNMIASEQKIAWEDVPQLHSKNSLIITSGILSTQRQHYLELTESWGWTLQEEKEEEGWLGFVFVVKI